MVYTANFYADHASKHFKEFYTDDLMRSRRRKRDEDGPLGVRIPVC